MENIDTKSTIPLSFLKLILEIAQVYDANLTLEDFPDRLFIGEYNMIDNEQKVVFLDEQNPKHQTILKVLMEAGVLDAMISFGTTGHQTLKLSGNVLCFLDYKKNNINHNFLKLNAYYLYSPLNLELHQLSEEQMGNLSAIVALYRRENYKFLYFLNKRIKNMSELMRKKPFELNHFTDITKVILRLLHDLNKQFYKLTFDKQANVIQFKTRLSHLSRDVQYFQTVLLENTENSLTALENIYVFYQKYIQEIYLEWNPNDLDKWANLEVETLDEINRLQQEINDIFLRSSDYFEQLNEQSAKITKECRVLIELIERELLNHKDLHWNSEKAEALLEFLYEDKEEQRMRLEEIMYLYQLNHWLQKRFPQAEFRNLRGFCKITNKEEIENKQKFLEDI